MESKRISEDEYKKALSIVLEYEKDLGITKEVLKRLNLSKPIKNLVSIRLLNYILASLEVDGNTLLKDFIVMDFNSIYKSNFSTKSKKELISLIKEYKNYV